MNCIGVYLQAQHTDALQIQLNQQEAVVRLVHLFDIRRHFAQCRLLDACLYFSRKLHVGVVLDLGRYDWRRYGLGRIDDLNDTRHTLCNVHGRDAGEMERLQSHLGARLADTLSGQRTNSRSRFGYGSIVFVSSLKLTLLETVLTFN